MVSKKIKIVQQDHPTLRKNAQDVPVSKIKSRPIQAIIKNMFLAMEQEEDAVAIAAPQINEPLRIFVVSPKIMTANKPKVFINPEIIKVSKEKEWMEEGCLSVRWLYGKVKRHKKVTIKAYNEKGLLFTAGSSGLTAQIFQHETDHLNGTLFIDNAKDIVDLPPKNDD